MDSKIDSNSSSHLLKFTKVKNHLNLDGYWEELKPHPSIMSRTSLIYYKDGLYTFGGEYTNSWASNENYESTLHRYDIRTNVWSEISKGLNRCSHFSYVRDDYLYFFGGISRTKGRIIEDMILERYKDGRCIEVNMTDINGQNYPESFCPGRREAAWAYSENDKTLWVYGGKYAKSDLDDFYELNLETNIWKSINLRGVNRPPLHASVSLASATKFLVLFCGDNRTRGYDGSIYLCDKSTYVWTHVPDHTILKGECRPPKKIIDYCMVGHMDDFYLFGGSANKNWTDDLYRYDSIYNSWSLIHIPNGTVAELKLFRKPEYNTAYIHDDYMYMIMDPDGSHKFARYKLPVSKNCLGKDVKKLFDGNLYPFDIKFLIKGKENKLEEYMAHSAIVCGRCPGLAKMISQKYDTLKRDEVMVVLIPDGIREDIFKLILHFIYHDDLVTPEVDESDKALDLIIHLSTVALEYGLPRLRYICHRYLEEFINGSNVMDCLILSNFIGDDDFKMYCLEIISDKANFDAASIGPLYKTLDPTTVTDIVSLKCKKDSDKADQNVRFRLIKDGDHDTYIHKIGTMEVDLKNMLAVDDGAAWCRDVTLEVPDEDTDMEGREIDDANDGVTVKKFSTIKCHGAILACRSSYFEGLFRTSKYTTETMSVTIDKFTPTPKALKVLISFMYGDESTLSIEREDALLLYPASDYLMFSNNRLQVICKMVLEQEVENIPSNVFDILGKLDKFHDTSYHYEICKHLLSYYMKKQKTIYPELKAFGYDVLHDITQTFL